MATKTKEGRRDSFRCFAGGGLSDTEAKRINTVLAIYETEIEQLKNLVDLFRDRAETAAKYERERIADYVETWGGYPPSPLGRRAQLAKEIREMT